jgi:hypothetical protein
MSGTGNSGLPGLLVHAWLRSSWNRSGALAKFRGTLTQPRRRFGGCDMPLSSGI